MKSVVGTTELLYLLRAVLSHAKDLFRVCLSKLHEFKGQIEVECVRALGYLLRHLSLLFLGHVLELTFRCLLSLRGCLEPFHLELDRGKGFGEIIHRFL